MENNIINNINNEPNDLNMLEENIDLIDPLEEKSKVKDKKPNEESQKGMFEYATTGFERVFTKRNIYLLCFVTFIISTMILRNDIYRGMIVDVEAIEQSILDIKNREIFVSSKLVGYKNQDLIEAEIQNKKLNLAISEDVPYTIEDENK